MATMKRGTSMAVTALALGVIMTGCARSAEAPSASATSSAGQASSAAADLKALVPAPANATVTKGPDAIADGGMHFYYQVNGAPADVMNGFKSALEGKGWAMTTIVSSGNGGGGGGATFTGTNGDSYGVFDGGGYKTNTYIDVCTWPVKPANPNCVRSER